MRIKSTRCVEIVSLLPQDESEASKSPYHKDALVEVDVRFGPYWCFITAVNKTDQVIQIQVLRRLVHQFQLHLD